MATPIPDISVETLSGPELQAAIDGLKTGPQSSVLWEHLVSTSYQPHTDAAAGARVTQHSRARSYTYLTLPFVSAQGTTARLVWDDVLGHIRTGFGLPVQAADVLARVDVHEVVNGAVAHTQSLVRRPNQDVEVLDAQGRVIQTVPHDRLGPAQAVTVEEAISDCTLCQGAVDVLIGVVGCSIGQYFLCDWVCIGVTAGNVPICQILCGIMVGLVCWIGGNALKTAVCQPWCG